MLVIHNNPSFVNTMRKCSNRGRVYILVCCFCSSKTKASENTEGWFVAYMFKMQIISICVILSMLILNILCNGQKNESWSIIFNPPEVIAVPGLCALISCTFTYPDETKRFTNFEWRVCNATKCSQPFFNNKTKENDNGRIKMLDPDLDTKNCSFIIKDIQPEDQGEYVFRVEPPGLNETLFKPGVKISIQDEPIMYVPLLSEGKEANLTCSAPFPCPETPPEITWWIKTSGGNITDLKDNITTLTTSKSLYISTLTFTPSSDLHNATVGCDVNYGSKNISIKSILLVKCDTTESKVNESSGRSENMSWNDTKNTTGYLGIEDFFKSLDFSNIFTFVAGMACSALIFSVVLCCWVCCHRDKKHKVPTVNPDAEVSLEMVQTDVAQTGTNEETPLHGQLNGGNPNTVGPTDGAEDEGAVGMDAKEYDYASIDYSLLKDRVPEEGEKEPTDTDYAEIKRDKRGDGKEREVLQDGDDQIETQDQMEGEEELYSNAKELKS